MARIEIRPLDRVPLYISGNLSVGGMFLITQEPLPVGTNFRVCFALPASKDDITATGEVLWSRSQREAPDRQPGMGVKFKNLSPDDRKRIRSFVEARADTPKKPAKT